MSRPDVPQLVYPDSSQLAHLDGLLDREANRGESLLARLNATGSTMLITMQHVQEIAQLKHPESRARRLALLDRFERLIYAPFGSVHLVGAEIAVQVGAKLAKRTPDYSSIREFWGGIPARRDQIATDVESSITYWQGAARLRDLIAKLSNVTKATHRTMARAARRAGIGIRKAAVESPTFPWDWVRQQIEGSFPMTSPVGRVLRERLLREHEIVMREKDLRRGQEIALGLYRLPVTQHVPDVDLPAVAVFFQVAREELLSGASPTAPGAGILLAPVALLNPYECPGQSLAIAVLRGQQLDGSPARASDVLDSDHVAFAPYCDLLFVDSATSAYLRQASRRYANLLVPGAIDSIRVVSTPESFVSDVESIAVARRQ